MAYVSPDYPTKKAFKEAVARGVRHEPYELLGFVHVQPTGRIAIEGPHYPKPHRWYASCEMVDGAITKVS